MITTAEEFLALRSSSLPGEYLRATHEPAPIDVWLEVLAKYPEMNFWVAQNKTVPIEILEILSTNEDCRVRAMVASKRKLSEKLFQRLAADPDPAVRARVATNHNIPPALLQQLASDPSDLVSSAAQHQQHSQP